MENVDDQQSITPIESANIAIQKDSSAALSIPLTTQKPVGKRLAVFQNGRIFYNQLVHSGEYLASGININIGNADYNLSTQIYDPTFYDSSGRTWTAEVPPVVTQQGTFYFGGKSCLIREDPVRLNESCSFYCSFKLIQYDRSNNQYVVTLTNSSSLKVQLCINTSGQLYLIVGTKTVKTYSLVLPLKEWYSLVFLIKSKVTTLYVDEKNIGNYTITSLPDTNYQLGIAGIQSNVNSFCGCMSDINIACDTEAPANSFLRAGK